MYVFPRQPLPSFFLGLHHRDLTVRHPLATFFYHVGTMGILCRPEDGTSWLSYSLLGRAALSLGRNSTVACTLLCFVPS
ncbi:hypothetical protein K443DRAFT_563497 [Laccaria amethystina LaAM-08-1]|uniref:Uncharacterized protein n=1 Tax=Laccaria amethystina LaAM-08-1 TaxID=1095629 RepID=A0A0C9Y3X0_9AGAR|nr:hypothetical protein K443DRAFT_563497 [Laccaria amethystina LaAM-08-1]